MNTHRTHEAAFSNRRRHARVAARGLASHLQTASSSTPGLVVENISMGGMFVRSAAVLEVGTKVMLQVVRPGLKRAIQATGRVVSVVTPDQARAQGSVAGMGIRLDALDRDSELRLRSMVDEMFGAAEAAQAAQAAAAQKSASSAERDAMFLELAEARGTIDEQAERIAHLESEMKELRAELLRRNRTIADMAKWGRRAA